MPANITHETQLQILRELLFHPSVHFADLQKDTDLMSDHFNFHLNKLIEIGFVEKVQKGEYRLTVIGKEYANRMDTDTNEIERQPKISVLLLIERNNNGETEYLLQQRLKQPFFGFWGMMSGKVKFGDSFEATAARELAEETGLTGTFRFLSIYRKRDYSQNDNLLEDKVFVRMKTLNPTGVLIEDFEGGHNQWLTIKQIEELDKVFGGPQNFVTILTSNDTYITTEYTYDEASEY
ncbi:MAG: NUDIX domain-containing protein [Sphaerimonospora mesophila]